MHIAIENYRGIKSASFPLAGITLIAAENAKGKSAISQACGAVLSGTPIPIPGIPKTMAGMLVNSGASGGFAQVDFDGGSARIDWPKAAIKTKGDKMPPFVSQVAAGIESLTPPNSATDSAEQQKRRAELLIEILQAAPTFEDVAKRLADEGISAGTAENVWKSIVKQGWAGAHTQAKETGAQLKGQWKQVTGLNYGSKIAMNFIPNDWEPELAALSEETLQSCLSNARDSLESMIAVTAIDDSDREKVEALAAALAAREGDLSKLSADMAAITVAGKAAAEAIKHLRNPAAIKSHDCPHCKGALMISGEGIVAAAEISDADVKAWDSANAELAELRAQSTAKTAAIGEANRLVAESVAAVELLAKLGAGNASADQVEAARREVTNAEIRLQAYTQKMKSDRLLESINQNAVIVSALDTTGARQDKLNKKLALFLAEVNSSADFAGYSHVEIASDMSLHYGGRAWSVLAESERFRMRALLQITVASHDQSSAVVIDAADILDGGGRNGLLKLLRNLGVPSLICMTFPKREQVPSLAALNLGASYWIDGGNLAALA